MTCVAQTLVFWLWRKNSEDLEQAETTNLRYSAEDRNSSPDVFYTTALLKNFQKSSQETPVHESLFNKV